VSATERAAGVDVLVVGAERLRIVVPDRLPGIDGDRLARRPRTVRILLENLVRHASGDAGRLALAQRLAAGSTGEGDEIPFHPERILLQDFTGIPLVVDLAALRGAAAAAGIDPARVRPRVPVDLVIDHSVQVDSFGSARSLPINLEHEYARNGERYAFLRWSQGAFEGLHVVPPGNGIVHQVNLEFLASVVTLRANGGDLEAFPDTLVGTDSHTTMVNGVGVLGWGVGGIEAEAAMLGEPYYIAPPTVVGVRLDGRVPEGVTATDVVLTVTRRLRQHGVVEKFVEFEGPGLATLSVPDRATIANMCPEYGATAAFFPVDDATIAYLRGTGRPEAQLQLVEGYARRSGLWNDGRGIDYDETIAIDLGAIVPTIAGPGNPEESVALADAAPAFARSLHAYREAHGPAPPANGGRPYPADDPLQGVPEPPAEPPAAGAGRVTDGSVVIAAITSCTNTSNPSVMVGAGLLAQRALARGLRPPAFVKTSLAPGSKVVTEYLARAGLLAPLEQLGFGVVGYGCTTCIGNSGPLPAAVEQAVRASDLYVAAVLSGNRNFEARIHNLVRANYLMSPMLVVAYGLAGRMDLDLTRDPIGTDAEGRPVRLADLWPTTAEIRTIVDRVLDPEIYRAKYAAIYDGGPHWTALPTPTGVRYTWDPASTYLRDPPYFQLDPPLLPRGRELLAGARALAVLGDRVSTDHISPAGEIPPESPAGRYLLDHDVSPAEFNTYGTRRGNHEVMMRGTFANVRLKNRLAAPKEGGYTVHVPTGTSMSIFDAAARYRSDGVGQIVIAGQGYGQGSSRDWAAKGPRLLGVRAVIVESFERIHRSNLVGMGVLPLQFAPGVGAKSLGLTGRESFDLALRTDGGLRPRTDVELVATADDGTQTRTTLRCRIDSEPELAYYRDGGFLPYILRRLAG